MNTVLAADAVLVIHFVYVSVVVLSVPLILVGWIRKWQWVRNFWFRLIHLFMIVIVTVESFLGVRCPLTVWESSLRKSAGQVAYQDQDFIATWLGRVMFYHFSSWVFTAVYTAFGLLVLSLFYIVPVKRTRD